MANNKDQSHFNFSEKDDSRNKIHQISQSGNFGIGALSGGTIQSGAVVAGQYNNGIINDLSEDISFVIDEESTELVNWLAEKQSISPELALKKAVATAVYLYQVTERNDSKLLLQRADKTITEIILK